MTRYVYLAGPIAGCTEGEAKDWRAYVEAELATLPGHIVGVSPLRCEPKIEGRYQLNYDDPKFGTPKAINAKNRFDTLRADIVLAYFPDVERLSVGTIMEVAWALWDGKPVIVVSRDARIVEHPLMTSTVPWILPTLDAGIDVVEGILSVYAQRMTY